MGWLRGALVLSSLGACLAACGAASEGASEVSPSVSASAGAEQALPPPPVAEVARDEPAREVVPRRTVEAVLDAGMGRLLQHVQVEPAREGGHFIGHRIVALEPTWQGGPVAVGDVVVRLNGSTLETPDKAQSALDTLRVSSEVVMELIRDGEPIRTRLAIE